MTKRRHNAFTLTEMLVVLGIIVVVVSLLLPAVMRARRQARQALCMSNFRQVGAQILIYAERNEDYIPLGTSRLKDPARPGIQPITPDKAPGVPWEWPDYHTRNNQYLWVEGSPSSALGPLFLSKMIRPTEAKILYCPLEQYKPFRWELNGPKYDQALAGEPVSILISYAVRPMHRIWIHDYVTHTAQYPELMPKLMRNDHIALMAEHPQRDPWNHGTDAAPLIHALYGDGSVRVVPVKAFAHLLGPYWTIDLPWFPDGYVYKSNHLAINEEDPKADTIWKRIDEYK